MKSLFNGYSTALSGGSVTSGIVSVALAFVYGNGQVASSEQWDRNSVVPLYRLLSANLQFLALFLSGL